MKLQNMTAVVTGGGTGIGLAIAKALVAEGCKVLIAGRREKKLIEAAEHSGVSFLTHPVDVADRGSVGDLFRYAREELGHIDILVNSAGVNIRNRSMAEMQPEDWDRVLAINATGTYNCMYEVLPEMRAREDGLVINISSIAGVRASSLGGVAYSAAKFAQTALGASVALEVGQSGVRITNIYPGEVNTPILENRPMPVSDEHKERILQPEDVAAAALMVACLPPRAHVPDLVIKPTTQEFS